MLFNDLMVDCMTTFQQILFPAVGASKVKTFHQPAVSCLCSPEVGVLRDRRVLGKPSSTSAASVRGTTGTAPPQHLDVLLMSGGSWARQHLKPERDEYERYASMCSYRDLVI